tara:strand:+ start:166 stop:1563 length:1398 start_codon:yes stop_codon:yes gene_type:complete
MKQWCFEFLVLCSFIGFSKEITVDTNFGALRLNKTLQFSKIDNDNQTPWLHKYSLLSDIERNEINISYWLKLDLNNVTENDILMVFETPTFSINSMKFYKFENDSLKVIQEITKIRRKEINFKLQLPPGNHKYYFKVDFGKNTYLNAHLKTATFFKKDQQLNLLFKGFFYGLVLVIVLVNFILCFRLSDRLYKYYALWVLFYALVLLEMDGAMIGVSKYFSHVEGLKVVLYTVALYFLLRFFLVSIKFKETHKKWIQLFWFVFAIEILCGLSFIFSKNLFLYGIWIKLNDTVIFCIYTLAIFNVRKNRTAQLLVLAFTTLAIFSIIYNISAEIILIDVGFTNNHLKMGVIVEVLILTYAITYRYKNIVEEKNQLANRIKDEKKLIYRKEQQLFQNYAKDLDLTNREITILKHLIEGKSNESIAKNCGVKLATIKYHNSNIYFKASVNSRKEIIFKYFLYKKKNSQ